MQTERDAMDYLFGLFGNPAREAVVERGTDAVLRDCAPPTDASCGPVIPFEAVVEMGTDAILKERFLRYAMDIGLRHDQAAAILEEEEEPLTMQSFRGLLASVAIAAAPRLAREASQMALVSEITSAIAVAGMDQAYLARRIP